MVKKTFTYVDFDGETRTEEHFFNLNKAELVKFLTTSDGYTIDKLMLRLSQENNGLKAMEIFEDLIHKSYGRKSLDGRKFEKSEELWLDFKESEPYSMLFMELIGDAAAAAKFIKELLPNDISLEIDKILKEDPKAAKYLTGADLKNP